VDLDDVVGLRGVLLLERLVMSGVGLVTGRVKEAMV